MGAKHDLLSLHDGSMISVIYHLGYVVRIPIVKDFDHLRLFLYTTRYYRAIHCRMFVQSCDRVVECFHLSTYPRVLHVGYASRNTYNSAVS